jgi:uncharacterized protein (DUF2062 family)
VQLHENNNASLAFALVLPRMQFLNRARAFIRFFSKRKNIKRLAVKYLFQSHESIAIKALSVGLGVTFAILPIWGFQMLAAVAVATLCKLNKFLTAVATHVSPPPVVPFVIFLSFETGKLFTANRAVSLRIDSSLTLKSIQMNLFQYIYGSMLSYSVMWLYQLSKSKWHRKVGINA